MTAIRLTRNSAIVARRSSVPGTPLPSRRLSPSLALSPRTYFYAGERECDRPRDIFCESIDAVAAAAGGGFAAIKLTALGRPHLLLRLSETIAQTQNFFRVLTGSTWHNLVLSRINEREFLARLKVFLPPYPFIIPCSFFSGVRCANRQRRRAKLVQDG